MITLICGSAIPAARRLLLSSVELDQTMIVVQNNLAASAVAGELSSRGTMVVTDALVITVDDLVDRLVHESIDDSKSVPSDVSRATLRAIIDSDPGAFDFLVGKHSVPHMSQGVLERIAKAVDSLRNRNAAELEEAEDTQMSPRARQIADLAERFEKRLVDGGYRLLQYAQMEALANLTEKQWNDVCPGVQRIIFLDFSYYTDVTYLLAGAANRYVSNCDILLDFDPEADTLAPGMEAAYQRLYDMSEAVCLSPEDLSDLAFDYLPESEQRTNATIVKPVNVSEEVHAAAAVVRRLIDDAEEGASPSIVVALANWHDYAPALEQKFEDFGIDAVWRETQPVVHGAEMLLLDRVRQCSVRTVTGSSVSALLRAPGFPCILPQQISAVDVWELASRLDYALTLTGQLQGWRNIITSVQVVLQTIQSDRKRQGQWTEEEAAYDTTLINLLKQCQQLIKDFGKKAAIKDWCRRVAEILQKVETGNECSQDSMTRARATELKHTLVKLGGFADLLATEDIAFSYFITLLRTAMQGNTVDNQDEFQTIPVTVCSPEDAASMRSNCCLVLGCNDGNFPQFARPDAAFVGYSFHTNQAALRARQRLVLERILRNHVRVLLWMPSRVGTEEVLPSQFVEELVASGRCVETSAEMLVATMKAPRQGSGRRQRLELVESLKGLVLDQGELKRFGQRGPLVFNIAANLSVLAHRSQANLAGYDGVIRDPDLKNWLAAWAGRHIYSVSQLDSVVGCSFRFFVDRMLHLEELEETDDLLPAHLFGSFTHDVLARFYRDWVADGRGVPRPEDEGLAREKLLDAYYTEHEKFPDASDFAGDLLNLKLFGDLGEEGFGNNKQSLESVRDSGVLGQFLQMEMARGGDPAMDFLKPANFEVGFGMGRMQEDDPLTLPEHLELDLGEGEKIKLRGRIDRIDIASTGTFAVTDYKTGRIPEKREILGGYRTQLPVYTMVAERLLAGKVEVPEAAGGLYYSLRKGQNIKVSGVFFRSAYQKQAGVPGRGLKDEEFRATLEKVKSHMRHSLKAVREGYLTSTRHDPDTVCKYCPFEGFCYKDVERTAAFWAAREIDESAEETDATG